MKRKKLLTAFRSVHGRGKIHIRRNVKDQLFRHLFSEDKQALLELYNALHGTDYQDAEQLEIVTLESVVYLSMKNDLAFLVAGVLNLYEHQSTLNGNMPLRFLLYLAQEYQKLVAQEKANIYGNHRVDLPVPQCIVFYNGDRDAPDEQIQLLSEAFTNREVKSDAEITVHVLNINFGHNEELVEKCHKLWEYSYLIEQVKQNLNAGMERDKAVDFAVRHCIEHDILAEYLQRNRMEVQGMILEECDMKEVKKVWKKEAYEDGLLEGRQAGMQEGIQEGLQKGITMVQQQVIQNMLKSGASETYIMEMTGCSKEQLEAEKSLKI